MEQQPDADVEVFVVWSGQVGGRPRHVSEAAALMPDPRARHYWDGGRVVGAAFQSLSVEDREFRLADEAWDVWLLFGPDAEWTADGPPEPAWWEHQLGGRLPEERRLDAERFAHRAAGLARR